MKNEKVKTHGIEIVKAANILDSGMSADVISPEYGMFCATIDVRRFIFR